MRPLLPTLLPGLAALSLLALAASPAEPEARWWKGNTHTHTLWSDGDALPDVVMAWYRQRDYHFLALTDHNVLQQGDTWFPISERSGSRLRPEQVEAAEADLEVTFEQRAKGEGQDLRLSRLEELRTRFAEPGRFLVLPGEEVTSSWRSPGKDGRGHPIHVNALGLTRPLPPQQGDSVSEVLNRVLDSIADHGAEEQRTMVSHLNHPNFGWGVTWEDMATMRRGRFFELYNGHRSTNDQGAADRPGCEEMWDLANIRRSLGSDLPLLYGVATDDAHHYSGNPVAAPGRAWIQVRAERLETEALLAAMQAGDFYASTGVVLDDLQADPEGDVGTLSVTAAPREGEELTIEFWGARRPADGAVPVPELLASGPGPERNYTWTPGHLFVRAKVISNLPHPDPAFEGERQAAWTQPVRTR
jgi:hypothetical protein